MPSQSLNPRIFFPLCRCEFTYQPLKLSSGRRPAQAEHPAVRSCCGRVPESPDPCPGHQLVQRAVPAGGAPAQQPHVGRRLRRGREAARQTPPAVREHPRYTTDKGHVGNLHFVPLTSLIGEPSSFLKNKAERKQTLAKRLK